MINANNISIDDPAIIETAAAIVKVTVTVFDTAGPAAAEIA